MSGRRRYALLAAVLLSIVAGLGTWAAATGTGPAAHSERRVTVGPHPASVDSAVLADASVAGSRALLDLGRLLGLAVVAIEAAAVAWRRHVTVDHRDRSALHRIRHAVGLRGPPRAWHFA